MTLTDTRPSAAAGPPAGRDAPAADASAAAPVERGLTAWLATGDHKRLGLLFAVLGIVAIVGGLGCALAYQLPSMGDAPDAFTAGGSQLAAAATAFTCLIGIPALWLGLATYVTPLQLGGHRLALPRLQHLALWLFVAGGAITTVAFIADRTHLASLAASAPAAAAKGKAASNATELLIAGLAVVAIGTLLAAVGLLTTVLNRRADGLRLRHLPAFSWSVFGTSLTLLLATPVFLAGLVVLYFDQHYGGTVFASGVGGLRIWEHELWLLGRPEALLFAAAGLGISCEVVSTALRRPLAGWPVAAAICAGAPLLTLVLWIGGTGALHSPFAPTASGVAVVLLVPAGLAVLTWLGSIRGSRPRPLPSLLPFLAHLLLLAVALAMLVAGAVGDVTGRADAQAFRNGQLVLLTIGLPLLDLAAGLVHWAPKLRGRVPTIATAGLPTLLLTAGVLLLALPGHLVGLDAGDGVVTMGIVGAAVAIVGVLALLPTVVGPAGTASGDPYEGLTLEWAAASPPVRHNFDEIPEVRSPHPLHDARTAASTAGAGGEAATTTNGGDA
jgi:heme/copper-type cytochrome/quinol oxidase subunit 1